MPSQHLEDLSWHSSTSSGVCCPSLAGHSRLPVRCYRASAKKGTEHHLSEAESYAQALQLAKLESLDIRRTYLCHKYMAQMKSSSHPLHHLLPSPLLDVPNYNLRQYTQKHYLFRNNIVCRTKRAEEFFTFRYFN